MRLFLSLEDNDILRHVVARQALGDQPLTEFRSAPRGSTMANFARGTNMTMFSHGDRNIISLGVRKIGGKMQTFRSGWVSVCRSGSNALNTHKFRSGTHSHITEMSLGDCADVVGGSLACQGFFARWWHAPFCIRFGERHVRFELRSELTMLDRFSDDGKVS